MDKLGLYSPKRDKENKDYYYMSEREKFIRQDILNWMENRSWFDERFIPYKRGYMFFGKPGTGKTTFIRKLCQELNIPVRIIVLSSFRNSEFIIRFGEGINRFESALDFAVKRGIVELKGAWFNYGSNKFYMHIGFFIIVKFQVFQKYEIKYRKITRMYK